MFDLQEHTNSKTTQLYSWFLNLTYPTLPFVFVCARRICTLKKKKKGFSILSLLSSLSLLSLSIQR